jgi:hypothetical protein
MQSKARGGGLATREQQPPHPHPFSYELDRREASLEDVRPSRPTYPVGRQAEWCDRGGWGQGGRTDLNVQAVVLVLVIILLDVPCLGFRVQGLGFRVKGLGFRV